MRGGISTKIWLSIGIFVTGYVISVGTGQVQSLTTESRLNAASERLFPAAQQAQQAVESFQRAMRSFNDAVMMEDHDALRNAGEESAMVVGCLRAAAEAVPDAPERQRALRNTASLVERFGSDGQAVYGAMIEAKGNITPALQHQGRQLAARADEIRAQLSDLSGATGNDLKSGLKALAASSVRQRWMNLGLLAVSLLLSVFLVERTIRRAVIAPVARALEGVETATQEAAQAGNRMAETGELAATSATEQAACLRQTAASLEQVALMTRSNAERAGKADRLMGEIRREVEAGTGMMARLTTAIEEIAVASRRVAGILQTIDSLAFHTNILALNAAVEAARAGDAGAGFSVVADEVRSLAHRSAEAARDIAALIEGTMEKIETGSGLAEQSSQAYSRIAHNILSGSGVVSEIAHDSEAQRRGIEEISGAMSTMDDVTQTNARTAEQTAVAAKTLTSHVEAARTYVQELADVVGVS